MKYLLERDLCHMQGDDLQGMHCEEAVVSHRYKFKHLRAMVANLPLAKDATAQTSTKVGLPHQRLISLSFSVNTAFLLMKFVLTSQSMPALNKQGLVLAIILICVALFRSNVACTFNSLKAVVSKNCSAGDH